MQHQSHDHHAHAGHGDGSVAPAATAAPTILQVPTGPIACDACKAKVEQQLRRHPSVIDADVHPHHWMAVVTVRPGSVTAEELAELAAHACGDRNEVPLPKPEVSSHAHAHTAAPAGRAATDHAAMGPTSGRGPRSRISITTCRAPATSISSWTIFRRTSAAS